MSPMIDPATRSNARFSRNAAPPSTGGRRSKSGSPGAGTACTECDSSSAVVGASRTGIARRRQTSSSSSTGASSPAHPVRITSSIAAGSSARRSSPCPAPPVSSPSPAVSWCRPTTRYATPWRLSERSRLSAIDATSAGAPTSSARRSNEIASSTSAVTLS